MGLCLFRYISLGAVTGSYEVVSGIDERFDGVWRVGGLWMDCLQQLSVVYLGAM